MARHWSAYAGAGLTDRQVKAADAIARSHGLGDGLDAIAKASGKSRSKAGKELANKHKARQLMDELFDRYGH